MNLFMLTYTIFNWTCSYLKFFIECKSQEKIKSKDEMNKIVKLELNNLMY